MTKKLLSFSVALLFTTLCLWGCSGNSGEESEKGAIRNMTDQVAHDLSHKLRDPIDKARAAKDKQEEHLNDWEDTAEESSRDD